MSFLKKFIKVDLDIIFLLSEYLSTFYYEKFNSIKKNINILGLALSLIISIYFKFMLESNLKILSDEAKIIIAYYFVVVIIFLLANVISKYKSIKNITQLFFLPISFNDYFIAFSFGNLNTIQFKFFILPFFVPLVVFKNSFIEIFGLVLLSIFLILLSQIMTNIITVILKIFILSKNILMQLLIIFISSISLVLFVLKRYYIFEFIRKIIDVKDYYQIFINLMFMVLIIIILSYLLKGVFRQMLSLLNG